MDDNAYLKSKKKKKKGKTKRKQKIKMYIYKYTKKGNTEHKSSVLYKIRAT
jgi:hypothetical protein